VKREIVSGGDQVGEWVFKLTGGGWTPGRGTSLGLLENGVLIAGVAYDNWNGSSLCMHVAAIRPKTWLNRPFAWAAFSYPFDQLKVRKVIGLVSSKNEAAIRFNRSLGFVCEATLADASPDADLLLFTMTREQCRWLNWNKASWESQAHHPPPTTEGLPLKRASSPATPPSSTPT
jgi:RimJ/RimL family protein N-acetyltransferase